MENCDLGEWLKESDEWSKLRKNFPALPNSRVLDQRQRAREVMDSRILDAFE